MDKNEEMMFKKIDELKEAWKDIQENVINWCLTPRSYLKKGYYSKITPATQKRSDEIIHILKCQVKNMLIDEKRLKEGYKFDELTNVYWLRQNLKDLITAKSGWHRDVYKENTNRSFGSREAPYIEFPKIINLTRELLKYSESNPEFTKRTGISYDLGMNQEGFFK